MSGYNSNIYPNIYNPANAPPPSAMSYPQGPPMQPGQVGFFPPPNMPGNPVPSTHLGQAYSAPPLGYPTYPTAPYYGQANMPMQNWQPALSPVEWVPTTPKDAAALSNRAVVGGYEGHDHSPLWVIRARYEGELIPGKLAIKHQTAYVPWDCKENLVSQIEVCCAQPDRVRWINSLKGQVPPGAVVGGHAATGEPLYIGRTKHDGSLTPGKVHPSHKVLYISYGGKEIGYENYEILVSP